MGQISATRNLVATKVVRHAGQNCLLVFFTLWFELWKNYDSTPTWGIRVCARYLWIVMKIRWRTHVNTCGLTFRKQITLDTKGKLLFFMLSSIGIVVGSLPSGDEALLVKMYSTHIGPPPGLAVQLTVMTSSNRNIFRVTGHLCGEFAVSGEFPAQRPVTRSFDVFFDLRLDKRLSKQSWGRWFETPSRPLWRHCNDILVHTFELN